MEPTPMTHIADIFRCPVCKNPVEGSFTVAVDLSIEPAPQPADSTTTDPTAVHVLAKHKITNLFVSHNCQRDSLARSVGGIIGGLVQDTATTAPATD